MPHAPVLRASSNEARPLDRYVNGCCVNRHIMQHTCTHAQLRTAHHAMSSSVKPRIKTTGYMWVWLLYQQIHIATRIPNLGQCFMHLSFVRQAMKRDHLIGRTWLQCRQTHIATHMHNKRPTKVFTTSDTQTSDRNKWNQQDSPHKWHTCHCTDKASNYRQCW